MQIENRSQRARSITQKSSVFYDLYESQEDMIDELVNAINSLFSPLSWILQETLYKRIQKQQKGWIDINYLHRNPKLAQIFQKYGIKQYSRRKRNILKKVIQQSIIKRKKDSIKRKQHIKINNQIHQVIYLQTKLSGIDEKQTNQNSLFNKINRIKEIMNRNGLKSIIEEQIVKLIYENKGSKVMQIEDEPQGSKINQKFKEYSLNGIEFLGNQCASTSEKQKPIGQQQIQFFKDKNCSNVSTNISQSFYRWCFVYLPNVDTEIVKQLKCRLSQKFQNLLDQRKQLSEQMNGLNLSQNSTKNIHTPSKQQSITIYSLEQMKNRFYIEYENICRKIGYKKTDYREISLKRKQKERQNEKRRLMEAKNLDDKIDLELNYHKKLQIQKERQEYLEKLQQKRSEKKRRRIQRKRQSRVDNYNLSENRNYIDKIKDLIFNRNKQQKSQENIQNIKTAVETNQNYQKQQKTQKPTEPIEQNLKSDDKYEDEEKTPGIRIKLPKFTGNIDEDQLQKVSIGIQIDDHKEYQLPEEEEELEYLSQQQESSGQEFKVPKKRIRKQKQEDSKKKRKIVKQWSKSGQTKTQAKNIETIDSRSKSKRVQHYLAQKDCDQSNSNPVYNLRHKDRKEGSYRKMIEGNYEIQNKNKRDANEDKKQSDLLFDSSEEQEASKTRNLRQPRNVKRQNR